MYADYWNLTATPFENDADPRCFFSGGSHHPAVLKLRYLVEARRGVGLVVGEHGVGKTYVTHVMQSQLAAGSAPVIRIVYPQMTAHELLRDITVRLGATVDDCAFDQDATDSRVDQLIRSLEGQLTRHTNEGRSPVVIIDNAQLIDGPEVLEALSGLLQMSEQHRAGLTLILCGKPDLLSRIESVPGLNERVSVRMGICAFDETQTIAYVHHRLRIAGAEPSMFGDGALSMVWELSQGVPRRINQICDLALLVGYSDTLEVVTASDLRAASEELTSVAID